MAKFERIAEDRRKHRPRKRRVVNQDKWILDLIDDATDGGHFSTARGGVFYPSFLGSACDRHLWNEYNAVPKNDPITPQTQRKFDYGHDVEDRVDKYLQKMGVVQARELPIKQASPPISGRIDFIVKHPKNGATIVELKSIHENGFEALIDEPKPDHYVQTMLYMHMKGINFGIVLYENKNKQEYKAFKLTPDAEWWKNFTDRLYRIMAMKKPPVKCTGERYCKCGGKR